MIVNSSRTSIWSSTGDCPCPLNFKQLLNEAIHIWELFTSSHSGLREHWWQRHCVLRLRVMSRDVWPGSVTCHVSRQPPINTRPHSSANPLIFSVAPTYVTLKMQFWGKYPECPISWSPNVLSLQLVPAQLRGGGWVLPAASIAKYLRCTGACQFLSLLIVPIILAMNPWSLVEEKGRKQTPSRIQC